MDAPSSPASQLALAAGCLVVALAIGYGTTAAGLLAAGSRAARREQGHWTERARLRWPPIAVMSFGMLLAPAIAGLLLGHLAGSISLPGRAVGILAAVVAMGGVFVAAGWHAPRPDGPRRGLWARVRETAVLMLLFRTAIVVAVPAAMCMQEQFVPAVVWIQLSAVTILIVLCTGGLSVLLVALGAARPADPDVDARVRAAAARSGVAVRRVLVVETRSTNAAVLPLPRDVLLFRPILDFPADELDAVLAHEMGHLHESRLTGWVRLLPAVAIVHAVALPALCDVLGNVAGGLAALVPLLLCLLAARGVRRLESHADEHAHRHEGEDPARAGVYGRALARLAEANLSPVVTRGGSHPSLWERLEAAGYRPDFPRPAPPSMARLRLGLLAAIVTCVVTLAVGVFAVFLADALLR